MAETTIEWTSGRRADGSVVPGFTFNPWEGCEKISPACANCYAAERDRRFHGGNHWGPNSSRLFHGDSYWKQPMKWNKDAATAGERRKVFCASLADVFEDRPELEAPRARLIQLIDDTPNLDWLLLTKRPENITPLMKRASKGTFGIDWNFADHMPNVWLGTTVENQEQADKRIPELLKIPARVRFLSCEPLLGPVDLQKIKWPTGEKIFATPLTGELWLHTYGGPVKFDERTANIGGIDWVIAGGESGPGARPSHPDWFRSLRDQCTAAGVAYFFKQWGEYTPDEDGNLLNWQHDDPKLAGQVRRWTTACSTERKSVGKCSFYAYDANGAATRLQRVGKSAAGRLLDGRTWDEFPESKAPAPASI